MPHYIVRSEPIDDQRARTAIDITARSFPEVVIERRYVDHDGDGDTWICRAPADAHLERWADAVGLNRHSVRHVHPDPRRDRERSSLERPPEDIPCSTDDLD